MPTNEKIKQIRTPKGGSKGSGKGGGGGGGNNVKPSTPKKTWREKFTHKDSKTGKSAQDKVVAGLQGASDLAGMAGELEKEAGTIKGSGGFDPKFGMGEQGPSTVTRTKNPITGEWEFD